MILFKEMKIRYSAQLIIAALNEEPGIGLTIAEMKDALVDLKVLVVDGKSSDRTVEIAEELGAKVIFQDGSGKGDALAEGPKECRSQRGLCCFYRRRLHLSCLVCSKDA